MIKSIVTITDPCEEYCGPEEDELVSVSPAVLFEDEPSGQTTNHVTEEPEGPDQVDGVYLDPGVPGEVRLRGTQDCGDQTMTKLCQP